MDFSIRAATEEDTSVILKLIKELAVYEKEPDAVSITVADLKRYGFENNPRFHCFVGEVNGVVQGMALTYERFSTWKGPVLHLEDLVVSEKLRGSGLGTALLDEVVKYGNKLGVNRITWVVLNWNASAIEFYKKKGAEIDTVWDSVSLDEEGIKKYLSKI